DRSGEFTYHHRLHRSAHSTIIPITNRRQMRSTAIHSFVFLTAALGVWLLVTTPLAAQFTTASLSGTVTDTSGAVIPDAKVTVLNTDTGFTQTTTTGPAGDYLFTRSENTNSPSK